MYKEVAFVGHVGGNHVECTAVVADGRCIDSSPWAGGEDLETIEKFARVLGNYSGERTELHRELISDEFYDNSKEKALDYYLQFVEKDANNEAFVIPEYNF